MDYREFSGKTLESVISEACKSFSVEPGDIDYEIVDMGSTGFLGFNSRPTIIKAKIKDDYLKQQEESKRRQEEEEKKRQAEEQKKAENERIAAEKARLAAEKAAKEEKKKSQADPVQKKVNVSGLTNRPKAEKPVIDGDSEKAEPIPIDGDAVKTIARKFLEDVFKAMGLEVESNISLDEKSRCLDVVLSGDEMGILIGKRGQTLDSLQYLVSLVVNKETSEYVRVKIDTENYRERRQKTLENLAKNLAFKVKRTKRPVSLEPMNPYERRIIHSSLQGDRYVTTHSEGEEPFRRVVITLKNGK
ncbi:MAG: KH domain-containing protein [Lachnospiraceae bacterium]|nr:KH domain-containing protein [Lachnospiraceae bacterium]